MPERFSRLSNPDRFVEAIRRIDAVNAEDPNRDVVDGVEQPRELAYAKWLTHWVTELDPDPSEELLLAARSQHIGRWKIPRSGYPMTRPGYLEWRAGLKKFHADKTAEILAECGYDEASIERVRSLNLKKDLANDPEVQRLEDALCLVFLDRQLDALAAKTEPEKVINALRKSWKKMSPQARKRALELSYSPGAKSLLDRALSS